MKFLKVLPILPLRDNVIFPYMIFPVLVGREQSIRAANFALENSKFIFLAAQRRANIEEPKKEDIFIEGTVAKIIQILKLPNGLMKILVDGLIQGKIISFTDNKDFFEANIEVIVPEDDNAVEMNALIRQMTHLFKEYVKINRTIPAEAITAYDNIDEPDIDIIISSNRFSRDSTVYLNIFLKEVSHLPDKGIHLHRIIIRGYNYLNICFKKIFIVGKTNYFPLN